MCNKIFIHYPDVARTAGTESRGRISLAFALPDRVPSVRILFDPKYISSERFDPGEKRSSFLSLHQFVPRLPLIFVIFCSRACLLGHDLS